MYIHWICPITCNSRSTNITIFEQGLQPNHYHPLLQVDSDRPNIYSMSVWLFRHSFVSPSFCGTFQTFVKAGRRFFMGTVAGNSKGSTQHSRQECSSYLLICIPGPGPDRRILFICVCLFCLICIYIYILVWIASTGSHLFRDPTTCRVPPSSCQDSTRLWCTSRFVRVLTNMEFDVRFTSLQIFFGQNC